MTDVLVLQPIAEARSRRSYHAPGFSSCDVVQGSAHDPRIVCEAEIVEGVSLVVEQIDQFSPRSLKLSKGPKHMPCSILEPRLAPVMSDGMSRRRGDRGI